MAYKEIDQWTFERIRALSFLIYDKREDMKLAGTMADKLAIKREIAALIEERDQLLGD